MSAAPSEYLESLVTRLRTRLGERLVGAWLLGSAALGDFDPERSDLDVQAVSTDRLALAEREAVVAALSHEALPVPARGLEFVLYAREDLAAVDGPAYLLNLNTGPRMDRHVSFDPDENPRFWFVLDLAIARDHARALAGPPAPEILPALPRRLVLDSLREALAWYGEDDVVGAQVVLTATRAWAWATDGTWRSKREAARWAAARLDDPAPVERALALRADPGLPPLTGAERRAVLDRADAALTAAI